MCGPDRHAGITKTISLPLQLPVILALLGVWYHNFHKAESIALLPYDQVSDWAQWMNEWMNGDMKIHIIRHPPIHTTPLL